MGYWSRVGSRFLSITKSLMDITAPAVVDITVESLIKKACGEINIKLKELYKGTAINSAISFAINAVGVLLFILKPFGTLASRITGSVFFAAAFVFTLTRFILYCKNYGKLTVSITKSIFKNKSINKGISSFIVDQFPVVSMAYTGINLFSVFVPALNRVPQIEDTVSLFIKIFWKKLAIYVSIVTVYTVVVFWVIKPILLGLWG